MTDECQYCEKKLVCLTNGYELHHPYNQTWGSKYCEFNYNPTPEGCRNYVPNETRVDQINRWSRETKLKAIKKRERKGTLRLNTPNARIVNAASPR